VSRYRKGKTQWILLKQKIVSGSGISWAICKSAPRSRQTCQHPTTQFSTGWMPFLPPNQQHQSTEGTGSLTHNISPAVDVYECVYTERGVCLPTVLLWLMFLYIEVAVRLRELRNFPFHLDLCRPFAAHWSVPSVVLLTSASPNS